MPVQLEAQVLQALRVTMVLRVPLDLLVYLEILAQPGQPVRPALQAQWQGLRVQRVIVARQGLRGLRVRQVRLPALLELKAVRGRQVQQGPRQQWQDRRAQQDQMVVLALRVQPVQRLRLLVRPAQRVQMVAQGLQDPQGRLRPLLGQRVRQELLALLDLLGQPVRPAPPEQGQILPYQMKVHR